MGAVEVDFDACFEALGDIGFNGILAACVFAWEHKAVESSRFMRKEIQRYVDKHRGGRKKGKK